MLATAAPVITIAVISAIAVGIVVAGISAAAAHQ